MKVSNIERNRAADSAQGRRSTNLAGAKGMVWRDGVTESVGQIRDMTVVGFTFTDNDDGTGVLTAGGAEGTPSTQAAIVFIIDGVGAVISTGIKGSLQIPFDCVITAWTLLNDVSGSIVVDIWKDTYANYPPTDADSITAAAPPTVSSATKGTSSSLTGWTLAIAAGDILRFNVDSATTVTMVTLSLHITK